MRAQRGTGVELVVPLGFATPQTLAPRSKTFVGFGHVFIRCLSDPTENKFPTGPPQALLWECSVTQVWP